MGELAVEFRCRAWPHSHLAVHRGFGPPLPAKSNSLSSAAAAADRGNSQMKEKIQSPKFTHVE